MAIIGTIFVHQERICHFVPLLIPLGLPSLNESLVNDYLREDIDFNERYL